MQWPTMWSMVLALLPAQLSPVARQDVHARQRQRDELRRLLQEHAHTLLQWSLRAAQALLGFAVLVATATILYSLLYYLVIPSRLHEQEIFFDYGTRPGPSAQLNLLDAQHQWRASQLVEVEPQTNHVLVPSVKYDVLIELNVPESRVNHDVGMFMVRTTLLSRDGAFLASSARATIVRDSHALVQWVRTVFWLVPYALRLAEPSQTMVVLAVNGFRESKAHPLTGVEIELSHPEIQIYSAKLTIIAQLSGVRYLMYHWSVPTAILVILNIVFLEALGLLVLYALYNLPPPDDDDFGGKLNPTTAATGGSVVLDQGELFERHRSGGIPPVHVERAIKTEPMESSQLIDDASAGRFLEPKQEEELRLRYRGAIGESFEPPFEPPSSTASSFAE